VNVLSLIEDIVAKCEEVQEETEFLKTLAGKAKDAKWSDVDPGFTMLKTMATTQADTIIAKAQELKALIPP